MFIIPFIYKVTKENNVKVHAVHLLTIGGKQLWEEDAALDIDRDILEPNDLYQKGGLETILKNVHLCEVDTERTNIHDFYQWKEIDLYDDSTFCWKPYFHFEGDKQESWLPMPPKERLGRHDVSVIMDAILQRHVAKEVI